MGRPVFEAHIFFRRYCDVAGIGWLADMGVVIFRQPVSAMWCFGSDDVEKPHFRRKCLESLGTAKNQSEY